jgi:hypothetical protein
MVIYLAQCLRFWPARRPMAVAGLLASLCGLALAAAAIPARAQADSIWLCVDDQGHKTFQNVGNGRGCRRIDGLIATIPGTTPAPAPATGADSRGVAPASFPRIDRDTQRSRDNDRKRILEEELRVEQDRLARLKSDFNSGSPRPLGEEAVGSPPYRERVQRLLEDIERSEGYIASLKRELAPQHY